MRLIPSEMSPPLDLIQKAWRWIFEQLILCCGSRRQKECCERFIGAPALQICIQFSTKQPRSLAISLKIYFKQISFGVSAQQRIQFSRDQPRSLVQPLFTQHLFHVAENIKIFFLLFQRMQGFRISKDWAFFRCNMKSDWIFKQEKSFCDLLMSCSENVGVLLARRKRLMVEAFCKA